jgi:hypothetical protein
MPRQNRVTPFGEIISVPERGTFMGNRGCLHDANGHIRRSWQLERWLICLLEFKGRKRTVMTPGHYTELFFLDEATALAAGHRPCAECQRDHFNAFRQSLADDNLQIRSAVEIDHQLHSDRVVADRSKRTHSADLDDLPDGVFIQMPARRVTAHLVWKGKLLEWSAGGYCGQIDRPCAVKVHVLTPELIVRAIRGGYVPVVHPSARTLLDRR